MKPDQTTNVEELTRKLEKVYGFRKDGSFQQLGDITLYLRIISVRMITSTGSYTAPKIHIPSIGIARHGSNEADG